MGARILIIEDNEANLELARYLLECSGHAVTTAADGGSGLALALQLQPDLIISDLQMPVLDGYQLLANLRGGPDGAKWMVVALTAFSMVNDRINVLDAGFNGYFSKPIEPQTFVAQIEAFLPPRLRTRGPVAAG
jgi:two-component system cell cycle response regulator DivK